MGAFALQISKHEFVCQKKTRNPCDPKYEVFLPKKKKCSPDPTGLALFPKVVNDDRAQFTCSIYSERRIGKRGDTALLAARKKSVAQFSFRPPLVCAADRLLPLRTPIGGQRKSPHATDSRQSKVLQGLGVRAVNI